VPDSGRFTAAERADRSPEAVARTFHLFARIEAPQLDSPLYAELCYGVSADRELLEVARQTPPEQPPPNMLLAAVQYLLLRGSEHPLRAHYPAVCGEARPLATAFPLFRDFVLSHRQEVVELVTTRRTQTNVVRRCTVLLPAFGSIARSSARPLALLDLGASAGLNLNFDRYRYGYGSGGREVLRWGDPDSPVPLSADVRGAEPVPDPPETIPVAWRRGVDLDPIDLTDEAALLWLRALIWPEHQERHARLLYATHSLYQLPREGVARILEALSSHSAHRPVWLLGLEGTGTHFSELACVHFDRGTREARKLANASPHGWWLEWQDDRAGAPTRANSRWVHWLATHGAD
jgi:hypothetical protein